MKKLIIITLLLLTGCSSEGNSYAGISDIETVFNSYSKNQYYINCKLSTLSKSLFAKQKIVYFSDDNLDEIYLNIYGNKVIQDEPLLQIDLIKVNSEDVEWNWNDDFSSVFINHELKKGEKVIIDLEYKLKFTNDNDLFYVNRVNYPTNNNDDFFMKRRLRRIKTNDYIWDFKAINFYPVIAMHDENGWNVNDEKSYNTVADYYLNINVPSGYKLVFPSAPDSINSSLTSIGQYYIEFLDARDFSFSASKNYSKYNDILYEYDKYAVTTFVYSLKLNSSVESSRVLSLLDDALRYTEQAIGPYRHDSLIVEFGHSDDLSRAGIIYLPKENMDNYERIIYKLIKQWFYDIILIDGTTDPWLVDGITTFLTGDFFINNPELLDYDYYSKYNTNDESKKYLHDKYGGLSVLRSKDEFRSKEEYDVLVKYYGASVLKYYLDVKLDGDYQLLYKALNRFYDEYELDTPTINDFLIILEDETGVKDTKEWFIKYLSEFQVIEADT